MANKNKKSEKVAKKTTSVTTPPADIKSAVYETVQSVDAGIKETIAEVTIGKLATGNVSGLDANHRVDLNGQIIDLFVKNPNALSKFGDKVCDAMTQIAAVGVITAIADEAVNGNSTFAITVKKTAYDTLRLAAADMGITIPLQEKLLPGKTEDTVEVPSTDVIVSKETTESLKEEKKIEIAGDNKDIELDPNKVAELDENALVNALTYLLVTGLKRNKSIKDSLVETVDFMHSYRIALARKADNSTEAMNKYEDRTMYEWLSDIFSFVKPTTHLKGIGIGMHNLIAKEKSPLSAFIILRQNLTDKETKKPVWDDQSIADTVTAMVEMICHDRISAETKALNELDHSAKGYRAVSTAHLNQIAEEKNILNYLVNISFDIADKYNTKEADKDILMQSAYGRLLKMYYPECENRGGHYKGLNENLSQRAGIILNLFRSPGNTNQMYSESNITPVEEISIDEYNKIIEEQRKEELAAKKATTKKA